MLVLHKVAFCDASIHRPHRLPDLGPLMPPVLSETVSGMIRGP